MQILEHMRLTTAPWEKPQWVPVQQEEKHAEAVQFATYEQWCKSTSSEKQTAIKTGNEDIEQLTADIEKEESTASRLTKEITGHDAEIGAP